VIVLGLYLLLIVLRDTVRSIRRRIHPAVKNKLMLLFLLTIQIAVIGYWVYDDTAREDRNRFRSECVARPAYRFFSGYRDEPERDAALVKSPMKYGYYPKAVSEESRVFLEQAGLIHNAQSFPVMERPFTKILLITLESMD